MQLHDVDPDDADWIVSSLGAWACTDRWSAAWGHTPSPQLVSHLMWSDVVQQKVAATPDERRVAIFQITSPNFRDEFAYLELLADNSEVAAWDPLLSTFIGQAFDQLPLRKLCIALVEGDLSLPTALSQAEAIGSLRSHRRRGRQVFADVDLYELWADGGQVADDR